MNTENQTQNTGAKGVFPGHGVPSQGSIQVGPPIVENQNSDDYDITNIDSITPEKFVENSSTYMRLETKNSEEQISGIIDIDLISYRERGQESRYLSINMNGINMEANGIQSQVSISIDKESDFNILKEFISNLNWND